MNLIIDIGNSLVKTAVFNKETFVETNIFKDTDLEEVVALNKKKYNLKNCILSSVTDTVTVHNKEFLFDNFITLYYNTPVPFINKYATPTTLGVDRIALVSAAAVHYPNKNVLVIDTGTCITYDFLNKKNEYLGGGISPGLFMRYKAVNHYTAKLPLLKPFDNQLIGDSTDSSIHSGIVNGLRAEIDGIINQYHQEFRNLTVVLTGGDAIFLAKKLKSSIFAKPNFLLAGLNSILIFNSK